MSFSSCNAVFLLSFRFSYSGVAVIAIQGLSFCYRGRTQPALQAIDLHIAEGALLGLLGPNGAGKSTLLNILSALLPVQQGHVHIAGLSLAQHSKKIKQLSALVPQDFAFYPQLSARENLYFFAHVLGLQGRQAKQEIARCIAIAQLQSHADFRAATYSGGLKRRLNLAIGLLNRPQLILLDEPTVGVDAQSRHFLLDSIRQLNQQGTTVIYTSHYMEEVQQLCNRIAIIDHGKIQLEGDLSALLHDRKQQLCVQLATHLDAQQQQKLDLSLTALQYDSQQQQLTIRLDDEAQLAAVITQLQALGLVINSWQFGRTHSLEDVYLAITQRNLRD